jgi:anti-anti-sigma factor
VEVTVTQAQGRVPVTVLRTQGAIDHASFRGLIDAATEQYQAGARAILLDLGGTGYMSSSGLVALQSIARLLRGQEVLNLEDGWGSIRAIGEQPERSHHPTLKLLNVQPRVAETLEVVGLKEYFDLFTDEAEAVAAF